MSSICIVVMHSFSFSFVWVFAFPLRNDKTHRPRVQLDFPSQLCAWTSPEDTNIVTKSDRNPGFRREFSADFQSEFQELMHWRRDVRRFQKEKEVDEDILNQALLSAFHSAPSVGLSEPWRIVRVNSEESRLAAYTNFQEQNTKALEGYEGDKKQKYASLKLSGMKEAPVHLAIYCDDGTIKGSGLGAQSMPEMRRYSVVSAITLFWLAARCVGLGVGWVSILDPVRLTKDLGVSSDWTLVGYLCVGWPEEDNSTPELERREWENRTAINDLVIVSA